MRTIHIPFGLWMDLPEQSHLLTPATTGRHHPCDLPGQLSALRCPIGGCLPTGVKRHGDFTVTVVSRAREVACLCFRAVHENTTAPCWWQPRRRPLCVARAPADLLVSSRRRRRCRIAYCSCLHA